VKKQHPEQIEAKFIRLGRWPASGLRADLRRCPNDRGVRPRRETLRAGV